MRIGLDDATLERVAADPDAVKVGVRDLAVIAARGGIGATTVASTAYLAARAGIRLFATGGLGGVHRAARETWDESGDLTTLSRTPIMVVCSGVKSILDVGATLERLETLNVGVLGYRTDRFPGFYLRDSGHDVPWRVETPADAAAILRAHEELGAARRDRPGQPDRRRPTSWIATCTTGRSPAGLAAAEAADVHGKDVTPFLLEFFHEETTGASLAANEALVLSNARLAAEVAVAYCAPLMMHVVCVGDVMVDVLARLPGPLAVGSDTPAPVEFHGGGAAANVAAWLAAAGARATFLGRVGADPFGARATAELEASGVTVATSVDPQRPTGTCIVLVDPTGERTMIPRRRRERRARRGSVRPARRRRRAVRVRLRAARTRLAAVRARGARGRARGRGCRSRSTPRRRPRSPRSGAEFADWVGGGVLLFANSDEADVLGAGPRELAARCGEAVVKRGADGAVWSDGTDELSVPAAPARVVDGTGAGDAFAAGFLAARGDGADVPGCLRAAADLARPRDRRRPGRGRVSCCRRCCRRAARGARRPGRRSGSRPAGRTAARSAVGRRRTPCAPPMTPGSTAGRAPRSEGR